MHEEKQEKEEGNKTRTEDRRTKRRESSQMGVSTPTQLNKHINGLCTYLAEPKFLLEERGRRNKKKNRKQPSEKTKTTTNK